MSVARRCLTAARIVVGVLELTTPQRAGRWLGAAPVDRTDRWLLRASGARQVAQGLLTRDAAAGVSQVSALADLQAAVAWLRLGRPVPLQSPRHQGVELVPVAGRRAGHRAAALSAALAAAELALARRVDTPARQSTAQPQVMTPDQPLPPYDVAVPDEAHAAWVPAADSPVWPEPAGEEQQIMVGDREQRIVRLVGGAMDGATVPLAEGQSSYSVTDSDKGRVHYVPLPGRPDVLGLLQDRPPEPDGTSRRA